MQLEAVVKDNPGVLSHHLAKHKRIKTEKKKTTQMPVFSRKGKRFEEKIASKEVPGHKGFHLLSDMKRKRFEENKKASKEGLGPWSQGFPFTQQYEESKV